MIIYNIYCLVSAILSHSAIHAPHFHLPLSSHRQGCQAKHTPLCIPPSNPHFPASPSNLSPRNMAREKGDYRKCQFRSKTNSVEVNGLVAEMVVTKCGTRYAQYGGTRYLKSSNCSKVAVKKNSILFTEPVDVDSMLVSEMGSYGVLSESGSTGSFSLSSSTETHASSTHSADSNRTYITQSSICCKMDTLQDPQYSGLQRSYSEANEKSSRSISDEQLLINGSLPVNLISTKRTLSQKPTRVTCKASDRELNIPIKQANINFSHMESCEGDSSNDRNQVWEKFNGNELCTTWSDIAKNGNPRSDYLVYNIHSNSGPDQNIALCSSSKLSEKHNCKAEKKSDKDVRRLVEVEGSSKQVKETCLFLENLTDLRLSFPALVPCQSPKPDLRNACGVHFKEETNVGNIDNANYTNHKHSMFNEKRGKWSMCNKPDNCETGKENLVHLPKLYVAKFQTSESAYPIKSSTCHGYKGYYPSIPSKNKTGPTPISKNPLQIKLCPLPNSFNLGSRYSYHINTVVSCKLVAQYVL